MKLMITVAVVARDDTVTRASVRLEGTVDAGKIVSEKMTVDAALPYEIKILTGVTTVVDEMVSAGVSGVIFVSETVLPRLLQARKLLDRHNAVDIMTLPWMKKEGKEESYRAAFGALLAALRRAKNHDIMIVFHNTKELYRVKLEGAEGLSGTTVMLRNGISEEYGVRVIGNDRFAGTVRVSEREGKVYGEIIVDTLFGRAKSFIVYGREAVKSAMSLLPEFVAKEKPAVEIGGNF